MKTIADVAESQLCSGCGVCAFLEPGGITMVDIIDRGRRPLVADGHQTSIATLDACPGAGLEHRYDPEQPGLVTAMADTWGPILGVWEGHASDDGVRFSGSSGGAATALALHALAGEGMAGVVHTDADPERPYLNRTVFSQTPNDIVRATGSRYAPASPCDGLHHIEQASAPCVFIGKPCDVAGAVAASNTRPELKHRVGLTIAVFCAGVPSTQGTLEMLEVMGVEDREQLAGLRYRGNGWPGRATATMRDGTSSSLSYAESWGKILQKHRQWRCHVCADHTGEFADISVGDPWYEPPEGETDPGRSLIVARTERGKRIVEAAIAAGRLDVVPVDPEVVALSQPNLARTRGAVFGRVLVSRALGAAAPRYRRLPPFHLWLRELTFREKAQSVVGTARRVFRKKLRQRMSVRAVVESP